MPQPFLFANWQVLKHDLATDEASWRDVFSSRTPTIFFHSHSSFAAQLASEFRIFIFLVFYMKNYLLVQLQGIAFPLIIAIAASAWTPLSAADRIAVVVGNASYTSAPRLDNALRDAESIAALLAKAGFEVVRVADGTTEDVYAAVQKFRGKPSPPEVGLFYFAGHGVEVGSRNYLLPVNAILETESQLRTQAISVETVLADMKEAGVRAKLVILDCCRDNPLKRSWIATRGAGRGLAPMNEETLPEATMIMYAAGPGQPALDGEGLNSPFTTALLEHFSEPGVSAFDAFLAVSDAVDQSTKNRQTPWLKFDGAGKIFRAFTLGGGRVALPPPYSVVPKPQTAVPPPQPEVTPPPSISPPNRGALTLDQIFQSSNYAGFNAFSRGKILGRVQAKLAQLGYYAGASDGMTGPVTHDALVRWQAASGLPANGFVSNDSLIRLGLNDLPEQNAPKLAGRWLGTYFYGRGYTTQQKANPVSFDLIIPDSAGEMEFTGVYEEPYTGFGTPGPDGKMHGSIKGTASERNGKIHVIFEKSYRYFTQPAATNQGDLNPDTGRISGSWGFPDGSSGTFTLQRLQ
jgi:peptidoglycan hydrolase-like protein with peptidoglycan-binding domain